MKHTSNQISDRPKTAAFLGSKETGLRIFSCLIEVQADIEWTVLHFDDRSQPRSVLGRFEETSRQNRSRFEVVSSRKQAQEILRECKPDIAFVSGWYWLLSRAELDLVPEGFWGLHYSRLPSYRGGAPVVWALINGETQIGATVFRIGEGMDDGPILLQVTVDVDQDEHVASVVTRLDDAVLAELPAKWTSVLGGRAELAEQIGEATYCAQRIPVDGRINWEDSATQIHNFIRAQSPPYPCAFTQMEDLSIKISKSRLDDRTISCTPGQVVQISGSEVTIGCGHSTSLIVSEVIVGLSKREAASVLTSTGVRLK